MSKIKRFTRFIAVLLLTALSFGPAMAGTGGYGRRNINVNINRTIHNTVNTVQQTNAFNNLEISTNAGQFNASYLGYGNGSGSGNTSWNYSLNASQFAANVSNAVSHFEQLYSQTGTVPTAGEFNTYLNSLGETYNGSTPSYETFTASPTGCNSNGNSVQVANGCNSVTLSGFLGGMLDWAYHNCTYGGGSPCDGRYYQSYFDAGTSTGGFTAGSSTGTFDSTYTFTTTSFNSNKVTMSTGGKSLSGHKIGSITVNNNTTIHTTHNQTLSGSVSASATGTVYTMQMQVALSPIVLNMDGSGKLEASGGQWLPHPNHLYSGNLMLFDMKGDGFPMVMEWVGPQDGLLVHLNPNQIRPNGTAHVTGTDLFGTIGGWSNGYEKLAALDKDHDGKLMGAELKNLYVWQDLNDNGKVDPGELKSVQSLGITEIDTVPNARLVSHFVMNGKRYVMWDWYPNAISVVKTH